MTSINENLGFVTNQEEIHDIRTKGFPTAWMETETDRDGWPYKTMVRGYIYNNTLWKVTTDRDGWLIAYRK